ncbi:MAG: hypothetical protein ACUVRK_06250 [Spirochaetota bacterium]
MIDTLRTDLLASYLSREEIELIISLLFCCGDSNQQLADDLIKAGYITIKENGYTLTAQGKAYCDILVQKLAQFHVASAIMFRQYFENELKPLKNQIQTLKKQWRNTRDKRLQYKKNLMKQGKDKAAIKKDTQYKQWQKEQEALRLRMRHAEKEYNQKLSACIKRVGKIDY